MPRHRIILLLMLISAGIVQSQSNAEYLRNLLSDNSCLNLCWMGIEPSVTTEADLKSILTANQIDYQVTQNDEMKDFVISGYQHPLVALEKQDAIVIFVENEVVSAITISLKSLTFSDVLNELRTPENFSDKPNSIHINYPQHRLSFSVLRSDHASIVDVVIATQETINEFGEIPFVPCTESTQLCELSQSLHDATEIHDAITDEACQHSCWLEIEPGITTEDELIEILDANGYVYEIDETPFFAYLVEWMDAAFLVEDSGVRISIDHGVVSQISFQIADPPSKDALLLFPELPDLVFVNGPFNRLYADRQVIITIFGGFESGFPQSKTFVLSLIDTQQTEEILGYGDPRPCPVPAIMCGTPLHPPTLFPIASTEPMLMVSWSRENGADWYTLSVTSDEMAIERRVEIDEACDKSECTVTLDDSLPIGTYIVKVRGQNLAHLSDWSEPLEITTLSSN